MTHFPRVLGADRNAKLWSDEGVVDEAGHILEGLAVVLTGRQMVAATIKCKSNTNHVLFPTREIIRVTFDTVWTARVLSWRRAPEKWSKPGWPAKKEGSAWGKWSTDHLLMCMRPWCEGARYVIYESLCRQTTLSLSYSSHRIIQPSFSYSCHRGTTLHEKHVRCKWGRL